MNATIAQQAQEVTALVKLAASLMGVKQRDVLDVVGHRLPGNPLPKAHRNSPRMRSARLARYAVWRVLDERGWPISTIAAAFGCSTPAVHFASRLNPESSPTFKILLEALQLSPAR